MIITRKGNYKKFIAQEVNMSKRAKKVLVLLLCLVMSVMLTSVIGCNNKQPNSGNSGTTTTEKPVITVSDVPTSGLVGRPVTVPAATAVDGTGADISVSVKVTVAGLKENGEVGKEFIYNQAANVERTFTPTDAYVNYTITYSVKDSNGNSEKVVFNFVCEKDTTKPVIEITEEGFDLATGISSNVLDGIELPAISAIDQPGDVDVTASVKYTLMAGDTAVATGAYVAGKKLYVSDAGEYSLVINVLDAANNASDNVVVPVTLADSDFEGVNLLTPDRVVIGYDAYINEYGELCVGKNKTYGMGDDNPSAATLAGKKFAYGDIVGISVNFDAVPVVAGEIFYQIAFAINRSDSLVPSGNECVWPEMFDIRFEATRTTVRGSNVGDGTEAGGLQQMGSLRNGEDRQIYLQLVKTEGLATDAGATITLYMWVDKLPTETPNITATLTPGSADAQLGIIEQNKFNKVFNAESHYLTFGAYSNGYVNNWADDVMTVKAVTVYGSDETEFATDITPPAITLAGNVESIYALNEVANFPAATTTEGTVAMYLVNAEGKTEVTCDYVPTVAGSYVLVYEAKDEKGNYGYKRFSIKLAEKDLEAPEITLSSEADINVEVGEAFTIPTVTAQDAKDGDVTALVNVSIVGPDTESDLWSDEVIAEWSIMAVGEHYIVYTVADEFGNVAEKRVKVIVTGGKTGDLISAVPGYDVDDASVAINNSYMQYSEQKVLNEKVSVILNVTNDAGLLFFNIAGEVGGNHDWPNGMVMRFVTGAIEVSARGHDGYIFGRFPNPYNDAYNKDWDTLFEYQLTTLTVDNVEYVRIRLWFCGEELVPQSLVEGRGQYYVDVVENGEGLGILLPMQQITDNAPGNYKATYPHINSVNGFACEIKGLRIDGGEFATGSWSAPDRNRVLGFDVPTFSTESAKLNGEGTTSKVTSGDDATGGIPQPDSCKTVITAPKVESQTADKIVLERVNFSLQFVAEEGGAIDFTKTIKLQLLGSRPSNIWAVNFGLTIYKSSDNWVAINNCGGPYVGYADSENYAGVTSWVQNMAAGQKVWLGYQVTYNLNEGGKVVSVSLNLWYSLDGETWNAMELYYPAEGAEISADKYTITIPNTGLNAAGIVPSGVHMSIMGNTSTGAAEAGFYAVFGDVSVGTPE